MNNPSEPQPAVQSQHAVVKNQAAIETLISSLPPDIAITARKLIKVPGGRRMRFNEQLKRAYVLWHKRTDGVFSCTTFGNIASMDQALELWAEIERLSSPDTGVMTGLYSKVTGFPAD
jgi:hypothetical protein